MTAASARAVGNSSAVGDALVTVLVTDAALAALLPDGVWWDVAGKDARQFVVVSLVDHKDVPVFGGRGAETYLFLVKAVVLNRTGGNVKAAAARVDALLEDGTLTIPGYGFAAMYRERHIRITEVDAENASIRWLHRGGQYRVEVGLPPATTTRGTFSRGHDSQQGDTP